MALSYSSAIAALLNNGSQQVLPISVANLIELVASDKSKFGDSAQSVQDALSYLAGSFDHANTVANTAETNAKKYTDDAIGGLDVNAVGSSTKDGHEKYISYIWEKDGKIEAFAKDMTAANVAYVGGSDGRATVAAELEHINATIAKNLDATTLKLVNKAGEVVENKTVIADGTEYQLKQGTNVVAKFNIEKDSFVKSGKVVRGTRGEGGSVVEDPTGQTGEYFIKLEIKTHDDTGAGAAESTLYIPAESLVDAYKADNAGKNVIVTVTEADNTISAVIKAGGVGENELATDAVTTVKIKDAAVETAKIKDAAVTTNKIDALAVTTEKIDTSAVETAKIADKNVTLAKLEQSVQDSLGKANTAVQKITEGSTAGAINVDGTAVPVHGLANVATTGAAANVSVAKIADLDTMAGESVTDVQTALAKLTGKVKAINDGAVTSVKTNVVDTGNDAQGAVTISMTPTSKENSDVTVTLTHNLGAAAALGYDEKAVATPVSQAFWESVK